MAPDPPNINLNRTNVVAIKEDDATAFLDCLHGRPALGRLRQVAFDSPFMKQPEMSTEALDHGGNSSNSSCAEDFLRICLFEKSIQHR
jgi:hypothetical protein